MIPHGQPYLDCEVTLSNGNWGLIYGFLHGWEGSGWEVSHLQFRKFGAVKEIDVIRIANFTGWTAPFVNPYTGWKVLRADPAPLTDVIVQDIPLYEGENRRILGLVGFIQLDVVSSS